MGSYHDGHALVAAIRVLEVRGDKPPTLEELSETLNWHSDQVSVVTRQLESLGIIVAVTTPFDTRFEIVDHLKLEDISREEVGPGFADELAEYEEKAQKEQKRLENLFQTGDDGSRKRVQSLDEDFAKFKQGKPKDPFAGG